MTETPTTETWSSRAIAFKKNLALTASFGAWSEIGSPTLIDALAAAGAPWVAIDMQHGLETRSRVAACVRTADRWQIPALIRTPSDSADAITGALDTGAAAIIVPLVESRAQAEAIVAAATFAPAGRRSWGPISTLMVEPDLTPARSNDAVAVIVMIESERGWANRDEILSTPGVDGVFIGPADLSISFTGSLPTWPLAPVVEAAVADIASTAREHGVFLGYSCGSGDIAARRAAEGFTFLPLSSDLAFVKTGWAAINAAAQGNASAGGAPGGLYGA